MSPSSLIFVAVIAVWAAYLVIDTSRRREYLATAQSVERFSASMRVLQRRAIRRETAEAFEASAAPMRRTSSLLLHPGPQTVARAAAQARATQAATSPQGRMSRGGTAALAARQQAAARIRRARLMGLVALAGGVVALVSAVGAGFGLVSWILPVAGLALSVTMVVLMRRAAVAARSASRASAGRTARRASRSARTVRPAAPRTAQVAQAGASSAPVEEAEDLRPAATAMPIAQEYVPFDYSRYETPVVAQAQAVDFVPAEHVDLLYGEDGWQPVPVPPPTYTLKARAERPVPPPIEVAYEAEPVEAWYPADDVDEVYYRAAGQ